MSIQIEPLSKLNVVSYVGSFLKSLVRLRKLDISEDNFHEYDQVFQVPPPTFDAWQKTIGNQDSRDSYNTFYAYLNTDAFFTCVSKLGIDFKTILHLSSQIEYHDTDFRFEPLENYQYKARVEEISPYPSKNKAILKLKVEIFHDDELKITHYDSFFFRGVPENIYTALTAKKEVEAQFAGLSKRESILNKQLCEAVEFKVSPRMGVKYGLLSGDLNPLHTVEMVSKLAKHPSSFVQGLCSVNLTLCHLKDSFDIDLKDFQCTFIAPVFCGESYKILKLGDKFEVIDSKGNLKVCGSFNKVGIVKKNHKTAS